MGPYYVSALVTLLGPVVSVTGTASQTRTERTIGSGPRAGEVVPVEVNTHVTGTLTHTGGAISTLVMSFDAVRTKSPNLEIHGELGSLAVPDPTGSTALWSFVPSARRTGRCFRFRPVTRRPGVALE